MGTRRNTGCYLILATVLLSVISSTKGELLQEVLEDLENNPPEEEVQGKQQNDADSRTSLTDITTPASMPTIEYKTSSEPLVPNELQGNQLQSNQAMASLVFIAVIVAICVVGCVAFLGGAYFWYKHTSMTSSAARHVFYRSSDSSVLIHNDYQPMRGDDVNGHVTSTNNNLARLAEKTDYPAYGVTGPNPLRNSYKGPAIDSNLNRSAEVYHYQQQKQKLKALSSSASSDRSSHASNRSRPSTSDTLNNDITSGGEVQENDEENSDGEYTVYECPGPASKTDEPLEIHNPLFADSESTFSSYNLPSLGGGMTSSKYNYSTSVGNHG